MQKKCNRVTANFSRLKFFCCVISLMTALYGCAGPNVQKLGPVFFPPSPNPPRVQFLKAVSGSTDVEDPKSEFTLFATGQNKADQDKPIVRPYGIRYVKGKMYVCDTQGLPTIIIIDLINKKFEYLKGNQGIGRLKKPINLAVDDKGNIFVADTERKEIVMYNAAGEYLRAYGKGLGMKPVDVLADADSIYVLDLAKNEIKIFNRQSGELERAIGQNAEGVASLSIPTNFATDDKGQLYITNVGSGSMVKMDRDGHILNTFGKIGDSFGEFTRPKGIAVDNRGFIYIVDGGVQNVQVYNQYFRFLTFFGDPPLPAGGLNLPAGVAVTTENLDYFQKLADPGFVLEQVIFVTNQMGNDKISMYGLGHKTGSPELWKEVEQAKPAPPDSDKTDKKAAPEQDEKRKQ